MTVAWLSMRSSSIKPGIKASAGASEKIDSARFPQILILRVPPREYLLVSDSRMTTAILFVAPIWVTMILLSPTILDKIVGTLSNLMIKFHVPCKNVVHPPPPCSMLQLVKKLRTCLAQH